MTAESHNKIITDAKIIAGTMQVSSEVLVQKELSNERYWANFVGWIPGEFIFLDGPRQLVKQGFLFKGNVIFVRYLHLGTMYGFSTKVYDIIGYPLTVLLEWPEKVDVMRPRTARRAASNLSAQLFLLQPDGDHSQFPAMLRDLSGAGCKVLVARDKDSENYFKAEAPAAVHVKIPGEDKPFTLRAEIRNILKQKKDIVLGLRFTEDQPEKRAAIEVVVGRQILLG